MKRRHMTKRFAATALSVLLFAFGGMSAFASAEAESAPVEASVEESASEEGSASEEVSFGASVEVYEVTSNEDGEKGVALLGAAETSEDAESIDDIDFEGLVNEALDGTEDADDIVVAEKADAVETEAVVIEETADTASEADIVEDAEDIAAEEETVDTVSDTPLNVAKEKTMAVASETESNTTDEVTEGEDNQQEETNEQSYAWTVETSKEVEDNGDGTYLLKVSVKATAGDDTDTKTEVVSAVDIIYVVDESGSMSNYDTQCVVDAITAMTNEVGGSSNVQFAMIGFGMGRTEVDGKNYTARIHSGFTDKEGILSKTGDLKNNGYTPMDAALVVTNELLKTARPDSRKVVVVLCDGGFTMPNQEASDLLLNNGDLFYGISVNANEYKRYNPETKEYESYYKMEELTEVVEDSHAGVEGIHMHVESATLVDAFNEIAKQINKTYESVKSGHLTDVLSDAMDFADANYTLTVTDGNGNVIVLTQNEDGSYQLPADTKYNKNGGSVRVVKKNEGGKESIELIFSDDYQLESGWTYALSTLLVINPEFAAAYAGEVDGQGDEGTGTYALQDGVWTNINAESVFTFAGSVAEDGTENTVTLNLQRPVIQLNATPVVVPDSDNDSDRSEDEVVYEAPEVLGVVREEVEPEIVEDPTVLGARRNARTVDMSGILPVFLFSMSGVTFALSRKKSRKEDEAA